MKELYPGDQGIWVQYLQLALQRAGQQVMLDGIFGPKTCAAVENVMGSSGKWVYHTRGKSRRYFFLHCENV